MKRLFPVLACFAVLLLAPTRARGDMEVEGPWAGKLILVQVRSNPDQAALLQYAHIQRAGSAGIYLVGKQVAVAESGNDDWRNGAELWVPLDNLATVMVFNTVEEYQQRIGAPPRVGRRGATTRSSTGP